MLSPRPCKAAADSSFREAVRAGTAQLTVTGIDVKRDKGQDRARALKTLGWLALAWVAGAFALALSAFSVVTRPYG